MPAAHQELLHRKWDEPASPHPFEFLGVHNLLAKVIPVIDRVRCQHLPRTLSHFPSRRTVIVTRDATADCNLFALNNFGISRSKNIGVVDGNFLRDAEPAVLDGVATWARLLDQRGFSLENFAPIDWEEAIEIFRPIQASEAAKCHAGNFHEFEPEIRARLEWGATLERRELDILRERRDLFVQRMQQLFSRYDFLLLPTAPIARLENGVDHRLARDRILSYTTPVSVSGLPCLALPNRVGGTQLVAPHGADRELLRVGNLLSTQ
jgi:Asp-tRNA(Asn)/Glu-tRNA(Gln) amidotransferase A subunit family amidase